MASKTKEKRTKRKSMADSVRKTADKRKQGNRSISLPDGVSFMEVKKGTKEFRIVPFEVSVDNNTQDIEKGDLWYEKTYGLHFKIGPQEKTLICPRVTSDKPCPVCEEHSRLKRDPDVDDDVVRAFKPKVKQLFNVLEVGEKKLQVLDFSYYMFGRELETEVREGKPENAVFADPDDGKDLEVRFTEESIGNSKNTFLKATRIDFEDAKPLKDKFLDAAVDLDKAVNVPSYDEIEAILHGSDDTDETPKKDKKKAKKKGKKKETVEDDIPFEDDIPPKKNKKKKKKK